MMVALIVVGILVLWVLSVGLFMWSLGRYEYEDWLDDGRNR